MANDWFPKPDGDAVAKANQIVTVLEAKPISFGLVAADATRLRGKVTAFNNSLLSVDNANATLATAVANKNLARQALEDDLRPVVSQIQVRPAVTDALRVEAGLPVRDVTRTYSSPVAPAGLVVTPSADGRNKLKWNSGGNTDGVSYVVQVKRGTALDFSLLDVVSGLSYVDVAGIAGQRSEYRVLARRGTETSAASNAGAVH